MRTSSGKLIIFSAPSGAGKTTLVHHALKVFPELAFSVSACSRDRRPTEQDGVDYYFLGIDGFRKRIQENAFIEWEEVYIGNYYGTLRSEIERIWALGKHVIFDVDVVGGVNLKSQFGDKALSIFVKAPSLAHLEERLRLRDTETEESIGKRMEKAMREMEYANRFDVILLNDVMATAMNQSENIIREFLHR